MLTRLASNTSHLRVSMLRTSALFLTLMISSGCRNSGDFSMPFAPPRGVLDPCNPPNVASSALNDSSAADTSPGMLTPTIICDDSPPDIDPSAGGAYIGYTYDQCVNVSGNGSDLDNDGLRDICETQIARGLAPRLFIDLGDCDLNMWDAANHRLFGEYYYVVAKDPSTVFPEVQVVYMPAYYRDCGNQFAGGHPGDSEFIGVHAVFNPYTNHFVTDRVFLSAHCGTFIDLSAWQVPPFATDVYCHSYGAHEFGYDHDSAGPNVIVSSGKHANYHSVQACDDAYAYAAFGGIETCYPSDSSYRFPIEYAQQNAGSREQQLPWSSNGGSCPYANSIPPALSTRRECIWANEYFDFKGWFSNNPSAGGTGYGRHLEHYFGL